jgi:Flp pilus assembly protein CpaB
VKTARYILIISLLSLLAVFISRIAVDAAYADGIASVDAGPAPPVSTVTVLAAESVPDPVAAPLETASTVHRLWKSGHIPAAVIVGLWALLMLAQRWVPWLREGKRAVYIGIGLTFLGAFIERATQGNTPTLEMLLAAGITAVAAVLSPSKAVAK